MLATLVKDSQEVLFSQPLFSWILVVNIFVNHLHVDLPIGQPIQGLLLADHLSANQLLW
jgi:hypothetical protein